MALRTDWSERACPIARGIDILGDPWVLLILRESLTGARRFDDFKERLGVADNILTNRLKQMVTDGLLERVPYSTGVRPRHEYAPTEAATDALPLLHAYALWAERHTPTDSDRKLGILCRACGEESQHGERCTSCGATLVTANVTWMRPGRWQGAGIDLIDAVNA
jgi:DNA-binding HxlR family transcriptional regulator